ncbi:MAG: hypothetical protein ACYC33_03935 [Thermoleophilia bacterium]
MKIRTRDRESVRTSRPWSRPALLSSLFLLGGSLLIAGCGGTQTATTAAPGAAVTTATAGSVNTANGADTDGDGVPDSAEALLGTDPQVADTDGDGQNDAADAAPTSLDDPIVENATAAGFKIDSIILENNVDSGGADVSDHLELVVTNTGAADLGEGFELYYTLTDTVTGDVQSFYLPLNGFTLKAGESVHLNVDDGALPGHFRMDPNSSFFTGQNKLDVKATLHAPGFAPQTAGAQKDAAGAEAGGD